MLRIAAAGFAAGTAALQLAPALPAYPSAGLLVSLVGLVLLAALVARLPGAMSALMCGLAALATGYFWAAARADWRLAEALPAALEGVPLRLEGVVAELPEASGRGARFVFAVERVLTPGVQVPRRVALHWYSDRREEWLADQAAPLPVRAGERWQLTARLKRPHGTANPHAFEFEYWALERDIRATGSVYGDEENRRIQALVARPDYLVERWRESVRDRLRVVLEGSPRFGILTALAIGDQSAIGAELWRALWQTGVGHLVSISGLHVTMVGGLAAWLSASAWRRSRLALRVPTRKAAVAVGAIVALAYALLAGWSVPTQRTLAMLAVAAAALWLDRTLAPSRVLGCALLAVLVADPWAVAVPGFWLSFAAIGFMVWFASAAREGWLLAAARTQMAVTIGLAPILIGFFHQISLVSPLANALAIPAVSLVIVPLTLAGALLPLDWPLRLADLLAGWLLAAIQWLAAWPGATFDLPAPGLPALALALAGASWLLLPRGWPARWLGALGLLPLLLARPVAVAEGAVRLDALDVGQGSAVVVRTARHALLYDTGPGFADSDSGGRIIVPWLRGEGVGRLDGLVVSHADNDHAGGALSVLASLPVTWLLSSLSADSPIVARAAVARRCEQGQSWAWDGVRFEVLHPGADAYADRQRKTNDLSCVLRIRSAFGTALLAGDAETRSETEMLACCAARLESDVLLVPHHGSRTSSTPAFVAAVGAREVLYQMGYRNRFGHPRAEVVERYAASGSRAWRSDRDGAVTVRLDAEGTRLTAYRQEAPRYWRDLMAR